MPGLHRMPQDDNGTMRLLTSKAIGAALLCLLGIALPAQQVINNLPVRTYGSASVTPLVNANPNLPDGRGLYHPLGIAVDPASGFVYVSDTRNNRVLGFENYLALGTGKGASLVIGQADFDTTFATTLAGRPDSLNHPAGLAVDTQGNLYVADIGNHRVVRYPNPVQNWEGVGTRLLPDFVVGQPNLTSNTANPANAPTATSLRFPTVANVVNSAATVGITFDSDGNLWVTDFLNHRVLRYPAASLGQSNGPAADLVLGQPNFTTATAPPTNNLAARQNKATLHSPRGVAFLPGTSQLAVVDNIGRVLVYQSPSANGQAAFRVLGVPTQSQLSGGILAAANVLSASFGVFAATDDRIGVADTGNNRLLIYGPSSSWQNETLQYSPPATLLAGQLNFGDRDPNRGQGSPNNNGYTRPFGAVSAGGTVLVLDTGNHRVLGQALGELSLGPADAVMGQSGFTGNAPNLVEGREVNFPYGIAFDYSTTPARVYVADTGNHRVLGYRSIQRLRNREAADLVLGQPDLATTVMNYPSGNAEQPTQTGLSSPWGVAVDAEGRVWVADAGNGRAVRFPKPDFENPAVLPNADAVLGQANFTARNLTATQSTMSFPAGIAVSIIGSVTVSDRNLHRVLVFQEPLSNGMTASKVIGQSSFVTTETGAGADRFNSPRGLAVDASNRLYVADFGNDRVQIFENLDVLAPTGASAGVSVTQGFGTQALLDPEGIAINRQSGEIWVTEGPRARVLRYPDYNLLFLDPRASFFINTVTGLGNTALSVALDPLGFPVVGENASRLAFYVPRLSTTNAATYFTAQPSAPSAGQAPVGHLAPNTIASAFSYISNFDVTTEITNAEAQSVPLPTELSDIEITLDGRPLPLFFVSKGQINFFLPNDVPQSGVVLFEVRRKSNGDLLAGDFVGMSATAPGLFTANLQGSGQISALNYMGQNPDGVNSAANPVRRGQVIALFGTGMGHVPGAPNDGSAVDVALSTPGLPQVGGTFGFATVEYSGFAPGFVGLWQINVRIPDSVPPGSAVQLVVLHGKGANIGVLNGQQVNIQTTVAVRQP